MLFRGELKDMVTLIAICSYSVGKNLSLFKRIQEYDITYTTLYMPLYQEINL